MAKYDKSRNVIIDDDGTEYNCWRTNPGKMSPAGKAKADEFWTEEMYQAAEQAVTDATPPEVIEELKKGLDLNLRSASERFVSMRPNGNARYDTAFMNLLAAEKRRGGPLGSKLDTIDEWISQTVTPFHSAIYAELQAADDIVKINAVAIKCRYQHFADALEDTDPTVTLT